MGTKQQLAELLEANEDRYISGNDIADKLGITRAAVWKNIRQLEEDGYMIDAVKNRGYRLGELNDMLSKGSILRYLGEDYPKDSVDVFAEINSTNTYLKEHAEELEGWHTVISGCQTAGRGRLGRSFYSPQSTGLYLSVLLKLELSAYEATRITTAAAVSACRAIMECCGKEAGIKWVNDVFVDGKKVCGILTEASINVESGGLDWAVMGIGINVYEPEGGFPDEIRDIAGPVSRIREKDLRSRIAASFIRHFREICANLGTGDFAKEYRKHSFLIGKSIHVLKGGNRIPAEALDVDDECRLIVRYEDGTTEALSSGEVSVRPL